jgi:tRNA(Ile)-lysidine synthase
VKSNNKKSFSTRSFDQAVLRWMKQNDMAHKTIAVAVSGGVDSVVLLHVLSKWVRSLDLKLKVIHVNHGHLKRRTDAQKFVAKLSETKKLELLTNSQKPEKKLKSEEELRNFRWQTITSLLMTDSKAENQTIAPIVVTAHHLDDLLETQLIRLLRGTGLQGLQGAHASAAGSLRKIRPLEGVSRKDLLTYAKANKLKWFEDSSNADIEPLRNWVRHMWIAPLEKKNAGLKTSLARSLSLLSNTKPAITSQLPEGLIEQNKICLGEFLKLTRDQKEAVLAYYMHKLNLRNYSKNHISEILKRLDTGRRELTFKLLQREWSINAQHIFCQPSQTVPN